MDELEMLDNTLNEKNVKITELRSLLHHAQSAKAEAENYQQQAEKRVKELQAQLEQANERSQNFRKVLRGMNNAANYQHKPSAALLEAMQNAAYALI